MNCKSLLPYLAFLRSIHAHPVYPLTCVALWAFQGHLTKLNFFILIYPIPIANLEVCNAWSIRSVRILSRNSALIRPQLARRRGLEIRSVRPCEWQAFSSRSPIVYVVVALVLIVLPFSNLWIDIHVREIQFPRCIQIIILIHISSKRCSYPFPNNNSLALSVVVWCPRDSHADWV